MLQVQFAESLPLELEKGIEEYLRIGSNAECRRGIRYVVGLKENRWGLFGLKSQRQRLLAGKSIIVRLQASFVNPVEPLVLLSLVVRIDRPIPKFAQYALKFIDPVSVAWMRQIDKYTQLTGKS